MQNQLFPSQINFGIGYLVYEHERDHIRSLLATYKHEFNKCLLLTRNDVNHFSNFFQQTKICNYNSIKLNTGNFIETMQEDIDYFIQLFCLNNNKSIVILDRTDYLLEKYSFYHFMNSIYFINDIIVRTNSILFVIVHKSLLNETENLLLQKELKIIQQPSTVLNDYLLDILRIIHFENESSRVVDFKTIKNRLHITYPTVRKRLKQLEQNKLIRIKINGRNKIITITEKGELILNQK